MSREKRFWQEADEDFYPRSYIVYFLHKDITPRELKYIDKEIDRNKSQFNGLIVFTEDEKYLYNPKFEKIRYKESYIIPYNTKAWEIFEIIKNEKFMNNKVREIFGDKLISLKAKSFFEEYYIKENNAYTYIFYMPFANFYLIDYLNYLVTDTLISDAKVKVVCFEYCRKYIRKYLDDGVDVICI